MRVLSVVNWLNRGGVEVQLLQALPHLKRAGVDMDVCVMGPGVLDAEFAAQGCAIRRIPKTPNCYATARNFRHVLAENSYDVVHSHLGHTSGGFALGSALMSVPIVISIHSAATLSLRLCCKVPILRNLRTLWLNWNRKLMEQYARLFIAHSQTNLRAFIGNRSTKSAKYCVIQNGTEFPLEVLSRSAAREKLALGKDVLVLLHVGSLREEKNHQGLLKILVNVVRRRPETVLMLVGDGALRRRIAAEAEEMGLSARVRWEGIQQDVWPYYAAADVFVFPSLSEGFGNVLVESQAAGLPVVASDIPAHHESLSPEQHRFLFTLPQYDLAAEMALDQARAAAAGDNPWVASAQQYVREHFSIERFAADLQQLYSQLAAA